MNVAQKIDTGLVESFIPVQELTELVAMERALAKLKAVAATAANTTGTAAPPDATAGGNAKRRKQEPNMADGNTAQAAAVTAPQAGSNMTFEYLLDAAKESGQKEAQGADSLPQFFLEVTQGAFLGVIDTTANKHGSGINDAAKLTQARTQARTGSTIFDRKALNVRVAVNRTNTMIKLGMWPKGGPGEPLSTLNKLLTNHRKAIQAGKKVVDAANAMLNYARAQVRSDHVLMDSELEKCFLKPDPTKPSEEDKWVSLRKSLQAGKVGKGVDGTLDTDTADKMIALATKRLKAIAAAKAGTGATAPATP